MGATDSRDRLTHLAKAFQKIAQSTPELRVDPPVRRAARSPSAEPRPVFRVRLRSAEGDARARMYVHARGAKLEARSGAEDGDDLRAESDRLRIDLGRAYRWDTVTFHDAAEMASVLLTHMTRRMEAVGESGPAT
jgi:hypothetical protein